jgi:molybdate transport system substrate-binding protein
VPSLLVIDLGLLLPACAGHAPGRGEDGLVDFAGSQELRTQLEHGAAADVLASADERHMNELVTLGLVSGPAVFARNEPVIVVPVGRSPVKALGDLPLASRIVLGAAEVPIGRYSDQILGRAGGDLQARVMAKVVSREANVRQVLAKVTLGEADAAIVYRTDARAATDKVTVVTIPGEINVIAAYPIAVVAKAPHPGLAQAWAALVLSPAGQKALLDAGFLAP